MKPPGTFAIFLSISVGSYAYVLDGSCGPYKDMVIKGMKSAFDMSSAASSLLGTIPEQSKSDSWCRFLTPNNKFYDINIELLLQVLEHVGRRKEI
jgi:hypothetical protein